MKYSWEDIKYKVLITFWNLTNEKQHVELVRRLPPSDHLSDFQRFTLKENRDLVASTVMPLIGRTGWPQARDLFPERAHPLVRKWDGLLAKTRQTAYVFWNIHPSEWFDSSEEEKEEKEEVQETSEPSSLWTEKIAPRLQNVWNNILAGAKRRSKKRKARRAREKLRQKKSKASKAFSHAQKKAKKSKKSKEKPTKPTKPADSSADATTYTQHEVEALVEKKTKAAERGGFWQGIGSVAVILLTLLCVMLFLSQCILWGEGSGIFGQGTPFPTYTPLP